MPGLKRNFRYTLFFLILILSIPFYAQEPHFKIIELPPALSDCKINTVVQDGSGLIWVGTNCGLLHYDGFNFKRSNEINAEVSSLSKNKAGEVVVGCNSGEIFRKHNTSVAAVKIRDASANEQISSVIETRGGAVWLADYGSGLGRIYGTDTLMLRAENSGLADNYIYDLFFTNNKLYAASDAGIQIIHINDAGVDFDLLTMDDGLPDVMIQHLDTDKNGYLWAGGYDGGFCCIDPENDSVIFSTAERDWNYGPVSGILPIETEIWLTTRASGLLKFDKSSRKISQFREFSEMQISRFAGLIQLRSRELMAWSGNKIVHIPSMNFEFVHGNATNALKDVHALMTDNEGFIWYASENGLFRHSAEFSANATSQKITLPKSISYRDITCLHQDPKGYVWVGTFGEGLYRLNPGFKTGKIFNSHNGFINDNILSISSSADEIWFATLGGASRARLDSGTEHIQFQDFDKTGGLGNNFIYCVISDRKNRVWFATDGTGITVFENARFRNYGLESGLTSEKVYTITEDKKGGTWCATHDNKVFHFDNGTFVEINAGLEGNFTISSLQADKNDNLIIVHENGITRYNINTGSATFYGENYGVLPIDPEFNSTTKSLDGAIWIGTDNGLIKYLPGPLKADNSPLPVITAVDVLFEPVDFQNHNRFDHNRNFFTFKYAGLWYQQPDAVTYRVKLTGNDMDWIRTGDRQITYSRLSPGDYTFTVEAAANGTFKSAEAVSYNFTILRPFWSAIWFYMVLAIMVGLAIWLIFKVRMKRMERINAMQQEKIRYQFETLRSQVNPHFLFNSFSTLMTSIEEDKHQALEYVEKLSVFFRNILELRDKNLITLEEELRIAENYVYLQKSRYGENLVVEITVDDVNRNTHIPPLTLQLLFENAIKHNIISRSKPLHISVESTDGFLVISNNLQPKNFVDSSTGFGLKTIKHRYAMISESLVEIKEESGKFVVRLPLIRNEML